MTSTTISAEAVATRRVALIAERARLEQRQPALALADASGDAAASDELRQVTSRLAEIQTELQHQELVAKGIAEQRATAARAAQEAQAAAAAERQANAAASYQEAKVARDALAIDELEAWLAEGARLFARGVELGQNVDTTRASAGRAPDGSAHRVETPKAMAHRVHSFFIRELDRILPGLGFVFANGGAPREGAVAALTRANPVLTLALDADRKPRFVLDITGPNVRNVNTAVLPSPLPQGPRGVA